MSNEIKEILRLSKKYNLDPLKIENIIKEYKNSIYLKIVNQEEFKIPYIGKFKLKKSARNNKDS